MATIFRPPVIVVNYPRRKAADEWSVNLRVLYAPNPAIPFRQLDWPSAVRAKAKATGEAIAACAPIFTPNPAGPFNQSDWLNAALARQAQKSDAPKYFIPPKPFTEVSWPGVQRGLPAAKVDDVVNLSLLQAPVVVSAPFSQTDWRNAAQARQAQKSDAPPYFLLQIPTTPFSQNDWLNAAQVRQAAKPDVSTYFQTPVVVTAAPFNQTDWSIVAPPRKPVPVDTVELLLPFFGVAPFTNGLTETRTTQRQSVKSDIFVNLLPLQSAPVVLPFSQGDWVSAARQRSVANVDLIANPLPLQSAPVIFPFSLEDWSTVAKSRSPANVDLIERSSSLYTPNPDRPFIDPVMANLNASPRQTAVVDAVVNLVPIQNPGPPPPIGGPSEWLIRARRRGRR